MTPRYRYIWAVLALVLALTACSIRPEEPEPSTPTLPSFPQTLTPEQQLSAAMGKTMAQERYEIRYGTRTFAGEEAVEDARSQSVSQGSGLDRELMYEFAPGLPDREDFLSGFCAMPLRAIPSNTGVIRYEIAELDGVTAGELLYIDSRDMEPAGTLWTVAVTVDAAGRFSGLEIIGETQTETIVLFLELTFPDGP